MSQENDKSKRQAKANEPEELVVVYRSMGPLGAQVIKGKLESEGIPAVLKYESGSSVLPTLVDSMGEVQVLVTKSREEQALQVLGEAD
jgi:hypothetical protein